MPGQEHQTDIPRPAAYAASAEHDLVRDDHQGGVERTKRQRGKRYPQRRRR